MFKIKDLMVSILPDVNDNYADVLGCTAATCTCTPTKTPMFPQHRNEQKSASDLELAQLKRMLKTTKQ